MTDNQGPWISIAMFYVPDDPPRSGHDPIPSRLININFEKPGFIPVGVAVSAFGFDVPDREKITLDLQWMAPDGSELATTEFNMTIQAPWFGGMVAGTQQLPFPVYGMYWLHVRYQDRLLTRIPMLALLPESGPTPQA